MKSHVQSEGSRGTGRFQAKASRQEFWWEWKLEGPCDFTKQWRRMVMSPECPRGTPRTWGSLLRWEAGRF